MTEDEARTKFCPYVRPVMEYRVQDDSHLMVANVSGGVFHNDARCIASDCMMWRVQHWENSDGTPFPTDPRDQYPEEKFQQNGYCGLAK